MNTYIKSFELLNTYQTEGAKSVTVDLNEGRFRMTLAEAFQTFDDLAPGEPFQIIRFHY